MVKKDMGVVVDSLERVAPNLRIISLESNSWEKSPVASVSLTDTGVWKPVDVEESVTVWDLETLWPSSRSCAWSFCRP